VGSLDGLIALRQGVCQFAGCHLFDPLADEYNLPYVHHLFPGHYQMTGFHTPAVHLHLTGFQ
jgi:molybdate-binding protein